MPKAEIISEEPMLMAQVKTELDKAKKKYEDLNFRAQKNLDYLGQFSKQPKKKAEDLAKAIEKLDIPRLKDVHIYKITDMLPSNVNELKAILQGYAITVSNENLKKIVKTVQENS